MMEKWRFPRAKVLQTFYELLSPLVEKVFITTRPSASPLQLKDYAIVRMPNGIRDRGDTYQTCKLHLYLFVRDRPGEVENAFRLDELQSAVCAIFPLKTEILTADRPQILAGNADAGFHYLIIQVSVTINKKTINPNKS